jgi:hypothetical protein
MHRWFLAIFWLFLATLQTVAQSSSPLQITSFAAPPLGCNGPVIDPQSPLDFGSLVVGQQGGGGILPVQYRIDPGYSDKHDC